MQRQPPRPGRTPREEEEQEEEEEGGAAPGHGGSAARECGAGRPAAVKYAGGAAPVTHHRRPLPAAPPAPHGGQGGRRTRLLRGIPAPRLQGVPAAPRPPSPGWGCSSRRRATGACGRGGDAGRLLFARRVGSVSSSSSRFSSSSSSWFSPVPLARGRCLPSAPTVGSPRRPARPQHGRRAPPTGSVLPEAPKIRRCGDLTT